MVRGEPGVGKTALVTYCARRAKGMRVLRCVGTESEFDLAFSALDQLLRPVFDLLERVPDPQAAALAGALGLAPGSREDRFLIAAGVLSLLAEAAEERPLLCLVDDAQWLDPPSADALTFVSRRIEAESVVLLFAARDGEGRRFEGPGLPELLLSGLDARAAAALLDERVRSAIAPNVQARLLEATAGNPLALIELASLLSEQQLTGRKPLADPLPQGAGIESAFLRQAGRLPGAAQTLLLLAAAEGTGRLSTIMRAAARLGVEPEALDAAESSGLALVRGVEARVPSSARALRGSSRSDVRSATDDSSRACRCSRSRPGRRPPRLAPRGRDAGGRRRRGGRAGACGCARERTERVCGCRSRARASGRAGER